MPRLAGRLEGPREGGPVTPAEHFTWAQGRALEYVDMDQPGNALASLVSDLGKHESTAGILHPDLLMLATGELMLGGARGIRDFITGLAGPRDEEAPSNA